MTKTFPSHTLPPKPKSVIVELSATPEKFLEKGVKASRGESVGCLYQYLETKKLLDGETVSYPRVIGERDPNNPFHWRWAFNWKEKINGAWKGKSIGSIPPGAVPMIRLMQQQGATREDIIAFIKKAKSKKTSPKILDVCKNFDNTKLKPVLPDDAPIAVVLFAGGGGIEAGMVQAGIRPVIAVEFDPTKPELSRAIAKTHHHNFSEYGCRVVQLTVQEVAQSGFIGFPRRPDYLHASPVCANFSQAHTAKAGKGGETTDDLTAAIAIAEAIRKPIGWYDAIAHLIPMMTDSQLLPKQRQAVEQFLTANEPTPLLIERVGGRNGMKYKPGHLPCNTILRSHFTDHKGCNRSKFTDIWLADGTVKSLSIEGAAILQGFPGWYEFPDETATAGSIIGYSVPPSFATQLFISAQSKLLGVTV